jgi:hypothetical protein
MVMNIRDRYITDDEGRILILRGCNLAEKVPDPAPEGADPRNPADPSRAGLPFSPEEAETHFAGLHARGFTFIRLFITWEALEHQGPGIYDEAYLARLRKLLLAAEKTGLSVFINPCPEGRSRRRGAPGWVPEKIGLNPDRLALHSAYAGSTLSTLFFAGNCFAPDFRIEGVKAQDWLQERYLAAMRHCFRRLKNCAAIAGWGTAETPMGAPGRGFIGGKGSPGEETAGPIPGPFQAMAAASGYKTDIPVYASGSGGRYIAGYQTPDPRGLSLFKEGFSCPWKQAGVWTDEGGIPRLLRGDHFDLFGGRPVCFADDFLKPFLLRFIERIREAREKTMILIEGPPGEDPPAWSPGDAPGVVHAFRLPEGKTGKKGGTSPQEGGDSVSADLGKQVLRTRKRMGDIPCLAGAWDLEEEARSACYDGLDENLLHGAVETYRPELPPEGMSRPYPAATAGIPLMIRRDREGGSFIYRFRAEPDIEAPTEIHIPPPRSGGERDISLKVREPDTEPGAGKVRAFYDRERGKGIITNAGYRGDIEIIVMYSERKNSSTRF